MGLDFGHEVDYDFFDSDIATNIVYPFLLGLNRTIADNRLNIQIYLDAVISGWFNQLDNKCSRSQGDCTSIQLQLMSLPFIAESDSFPEPNDDPLGRYQLLNSDWTSSLVPGCKHGFPDQLRADKYVLTT